jgi:hypothetical protein
MHKCIYLFMYIYIYVRFGDAVIVELLKMKNLLPPTDQGAVQVDMYI